MGQFDSQEIIKMGGFLLDTSSSKVLEKDFHEEFNRFEKFISQTAAYFLTEEHIEKNADCFDWSMTSYISGFPQTFSEGFLDKFSEEIPWNLLLERNKLSNEFIANHPNFFNFDLPIMSRGCFNEEQLRKIEPYVKDFTLFIRPQSNVSEAFLREFHEKIKFSSVSGNIFEKVSISFLEDFQDHLDWNDITYSLVFTEEIFDKFGHRINWDQILQFYWISERLVDKYAHYIISYQKQKLLRKKKEISETGKYSGLDWNVQEPGNAAVNFI